MADLFALTLWRPWPFAILHLPEGAAKRVENRPWAPWPRVIGKRIALHAGKKFDDATSVLLASTPLSAPHYDEQKARDEGIVGTAIVKGWIRVDERGYLPGMNALAFTETLTQAEADAAAASPWFFGPYGWVLEGVRALPKPIPCKGAQGLWAVPLDVVGRIAVADPLLHGAEAFV